MKRLFTKIFKKKEEPQFTETEKKIIEHVILKINEQERPHKS